jgi:hypothetical protein
VAALLRTLCSGPSRPRGARLHHLGLPDFHEPQAILDVTFNGKNITAVNNSNWPLLNVPSLNKAMDKAERIIDPKARYAAWGKIDDQVTRTASAIRGSGSSTRPSSRAGSLRPRSSGTAADRM